MSINQSTSIEILDPIKLPLVNKIYKDHYPSGKANRAELIIVANINQQIHALLRLKSIEQYRLLTGMLVLPDSRGTGIGHDLLNYCENEVLDSSDYCFAFEHLESYYTRHGFMTINEDELPNSLKMLFQRYINSGKSLIPMHFNKPMPSIFAES